MPPTRLPIIGYPVAPTPLDGVLRAAFEEVGAGLVIEPMELRPHQLADGLSRLRADDAVAGALIAAPHKEKASLLCDALSDDARVSGAVNLLVRSDGRLKGHNTDADGIRAGLAAILPRVKGKWPRNAMVLGAGGGARAVVAVLIGSGFQHIVVLNRHLHRAEALVAHFTRTAHHLELRARPWHDAIIEAELSRAELLVNASGVGTEREESAIPDELMADGRYVLDLVLERAETPLMAAARQRAGTVSNGHDSFLAASASTVALLTGRTPSADILLNALTAEVAVQSEEVPQLGPSWDDASSVAIR